MTVIFLEKNASNFFLDQNVNAFTLDQNVNKLLLLDQNISNFPFHFKSKYQYVSIEIICQTPKFVSFKSKI